MLKGKKVFISGGAGVIGNSLVLKLYSEGAKIFVGDLKNRPKEWPKEILYRKGDLNFIKKNELEDFEPEYFFHLAASFERTIETFDFWHDNFHNNLKLGHHLMSILRNLKTLRKVIFASSYLVYNSNNFTFNTNKTLPVSLKEEDEIYPRNLTGSAKLLHEIELEFLSGFKVIPFQSVSARIFRVYGRNSRDVISRWIRLLLRDEELTLYNKDGMFDYIFADDVATGLINLALSNVNGVFNLGSGQPQKIEDILKILFKYFPNMKVKEEHSLLEIEKSYADMTNYKNLTGWMPNVSLQEGIKKLILFEKEEMVKAKHNSNKNLLITSVSNKIPIIKSIQKATEKFGEKVQIIGADLNSESIGKYFVDKFWEMPKIEELNLKELIKFCKDNCIYWIIPTRDGELSYFAKYKSKLELEDIHVMISGQKSINIGLDKLEFYKILRSLDFPVIPTYNSLDNLYYERFVVKDRYGSGSNNIGLNLIKEEAIQFASKLASPIFQPYIEGKEYSVDLYVSKEQKTKGVILRKRNIIVLGESQVTETERDMSIELIFSDLAEKLGLYGHVMFQFIKDYDNQIHIIECNCRFGGASNISLDVGLDSFYWFFLESTGEKINQIKFNRSNSEKKMIKYISELII